ncbi:MAG: ABC transporter ATP-binding protein [Acidimicrobiia bacterium]
MRFLLRSAIDSPVRALDGVSLSVGPGEVCAVVGPNGAGKSTLFRVLMGLTTPTTGHATVVGHDVSRESRRIRAQVGFMPADDRSLFLRHTCWQNLAFHGKLQGVPASKLERRIDETLEMVGLSHARDRAGHALSTGMRARLQLARALLHHPRVLILDEPTGSIDPIGAHQLLNLIEELTRELKLAVLLSSHRLEEIDALHDNVLFLDLGKVVHWGDLDALRSVWEQPRLTIEFKREGAALEARDVLIRLPGIELESVSDIALTVVTPDHLGDLLLHLDRLVADVSSVNAARMPLRDLLSKLITDSRGAEREHDASP